MIMSVCIARDCTWGPVGRSLGSSAWELLFWLWTAGGHHYRPTHMRVPNTPVPTLHPSRTPVPIIADATFDTAATRCVMRCTRGDDVTLETNIMH